MNLRPATMADARSLHAWRNDPLMRAMARKSDFVPYTEHVAWLTAALARDDRKIIIAEVNGTPIGCVRFDRTTSDAELSWTVAPEFRGRGLGAKMVTLAVDREMAPYPLRAEIKPGNLASIKVAESAGFRPTGLNNGLEIWIRTPL